VPQRNRRAHLAAAFVAAVLGGCGLLGSDETGQSGTAGSSSDRTDRADACSTRCHLTLADLCTDDTEVTAEFTATGWIDAATNLPDGVEVTVTATSDMASDGIAVGDGTVSHSAVVIEVGVTAPGETFEITGARASLDEGGAVTVDVRGTTRFTAELADRCDRTGAGVTASSSG
jgi:hypothetical protein